MLQVQEFGRVLECPGVGDLAAGERRLVILRRLSHWLGLVEELSRGGAPAAVLWPLLRVVERLEGELDTITQRYPISTVT